MSRLLRVYVDGPHGLGKTTAASALASERGDAIYLPEPMSYWSGAGEDDLVARVYTAQHRMDRGEIDAREAAGVVLGAQLTMSTPYVALNGLIAPHIGEEPSPGNATPPDLILIFDRHPIASLLCYPLARYLTRCLPIESVLSLIALIPPTPPGTNLILGTAPAEDHLSRLVARGRPGEFPDARMLRAIRYVYALLANTVKYLQSGGSWRADLGSEPPRLPLAPPEIGDPNNPGGHNTLLALIHGAGATRGCAAMTSWTLDLLADRLRSMNMFTVDYSAPPEACVAQMRNLLPSMQCTVTPKPESHRAVADAALAFMREMSNCK
uniref:Thymidine kinase n=1 Tax=Bovine alphaherpesvirus 2 TaxID=10295 RepID=A0A6H2U174_9ALPH|nr:thymidine kinase [Bovine alphaherpesvirus 2]